MYEPGQKEHILNWIFKRFLICFIFGILLYPDPHVNK